MLRHAEKGECQLVHNSLLSRKLPNSVKFPRPSQLRDAENVRRLTSLVVLLQNPAASQSE